MSALLTFKFRPFDGYATASILEVQASSMMHLIPASFSSLSVDSVAIMCILALMCVIHCLLYGN